MDCFLTDLKNKEVINVTNSEKMGYISDFEICTTNGEVSAIIVPEKNKFFMSQKSGGIRIPWESIAGIGEDIILVKISADV